MNDIDHAAIAARAHALYLKRGQQPGRAIEDWLEAERQLQAEAASAAPVAAVAAAVEASPPAATAEPSKKSTKRASKPRRPRRRGSSGA